MRSQSRAAPSRVSFKSSADMNARNPRSIRPSVALAALAFVAILASFTRAVIGSRATADPEPDERDEGGRRIVLRADEHPPGHSVDRLRDPGGRGSVREAWDRARLPTESSGPLPPLVEAFVDPQLSSFRRAWSDESPPPFEPVEQRAHVVRAHGIDIDPNEPCEVRVLPVRGQFTCLVRVMCGERVVYPNPSESAGYLNCTLDEHGRVAGADTAPTTIDGDPEIRFDRDSGRVRISNLDWNGPGTAFDVEVAIDFASTRLGV